MITSGPNRNTGMTSRLIELAIRRLPLPSLSLILQQ